MSKDLRYTFNPPDVRRMVYEANSQIPQGMVSTYGDIARALGDVKSSRAVGSIVADNPTPITVPCHRVVYSDGSVGWYGGKGRGKERKIELLESEGVRVVEGKVMDFDSIRFNEFSIDPILLRLQEEQQTVERSIDLRDLKSDMRFVAGLDVAYLGDSAFTAMLRYDMDGRLVEKAVDSMEVWFPYIPGYLTYREILPLSRVIDGREDTLYMVDGQGTLHPRGCGIACHVGVALDVATVGVAKSLLCGEVRGYSDPAPVVHEGAVKGMRLESGVKRGIYVSPGHRISIDDSVSVVSRFLKHRIPEPLRQAHIEANRARRSWRG